jgi:hypothetical protein
MLDFITYELTNINIFVNVVFVTVIMSLIVTSQIENETNH